MEDTFPLAEAILEQIADAAIFEDTTGTIRRWNRAATALFGYSAEEALGQKLDLIIPEGLRAAHWRLRKHNDHRCHETTGPPDPNPCDAPDRAQTLRRTDIFPRQGTSRRRGARRRCRRAT